MIKEQLIPFHDLELAAPMIRVVAHPIRLRIIDFFQHGEACVGDISATIEIGQAVTSQHLAVLRQNQILSCGVRASG